MTFREEAVIQEVYDYIKRTYDEHYHNGGIDTIDYIVSQSNDKGLEYLRGNVLKYAARCDKKGQFRKDLLKIIHYAILMMVYSDKENSDVSGKIGQ